MRNKGVHIIPAVFSPPKRSRYRAVRPKRFRTRTLFSTYRGIAGSRDKIKEEAAKKLTFFIYSGTSMWYNQMWERVVTSGSPWCKTIVGYST